VATGALMVRQEEAELERRFGIPYRLYRQRVPALIPALRRRQMAADHLP
jgi:protein-S-isoprenylcysteine O-methyltransferase Ste14